MLGDSSKFTQKLKVLRLRIYFLLPAQSLKVKKLLWNRVLRKNKPW